MEKKTFVSVAKSAGAEGQGSAVISTGSPDRDKDRLIPAGVRLDNYRRNPVVLYAHDHHALPVGKSAVLTVGEIDIRARWDWLENDEFANRVKNAWDQGALSATSVGFTPLQYKDNELGGYDFTEWELMEFSIVPVPANPEALALRMVKSLNDDFARRQHGAPGDDEVIRLVGDKGENLSYGDLRRLVKSGISEALQSTLDNSPDRALRELIGVDRKELAAIVQGAVRERMMWLTGRVPD